MGRRIRQASRRVVGLGFAAVVAVGLSACPSKSSETAGPSKPGDPNPGDGDGDSGIDPLVEQQVAAIAAAMNHYGPAIHTCWSIAAADEFRISGIVMLSIELGAGSSADVRSSEQVTVEKDDVGDKVLVDCLIELWKGVQWPAVFAVGDSIRLPPISFVAPDAQYVVSSAHATSYPLGGSESSHATILLDYKNTGNSAAAMTALTMEPGFEVAPHTHNATEVLYILKGSGTVSSAGKKATAVKAGSAVFIPAGAPHAFRADAADSVVALQLYTPGGVEQRFKGIDVGGTSKVKSISRSATKVAVKHHDDVKALPIAGGQVSLLFDVQSAPDGSASVAAMVIEPEVSIAKHRHDSATELLFVLEGGGTLTVAGETREVGRFDAIQIPPGVDHAFTGGAETTKVVQFYTPSGPEQRFKSQ